MITKRLVMLLDGRVVISCHVMLLNGRVVIMPRETSPGYILETSGPSRIRQVLEPHVCHVGDRYEKHAAGPSTGSTRNMQAEPSTGITRNTQAEPSTGST